MEESRIHSALGVDGGGTSCRIALVHDGRRFDVRTTGANVATDFDAAICTLKAGLSDACQQAGIALSEIADTPAFLGLAGVLATQAGAEVSRALGLTRARVTDDRIPTLAGAFDGKDGTVASIGTGSFLAQRAGPEVRFIGGYGLGLGDEASGAWLGRGLLQYCLHARDGIVPETKLVREAFSPFHGSTQDLIAFARKAGPDAYGRLAPSVVAAARAGDAAGCDLMQRGADYIEAALTAIGWAPGAPLCLTGGVGPHYADFLPPDIAASIVAPAGTGLEGALFLAHQMAKEAPQKRTGAC